MSEIPSVPPTPVPPVTPAPVHRSLIRWTNLPVPIPNLQGGTLATGFDVIWKLAITVIVILLLVHPGCLDRLRPVPPGPTPPGPTPPGPNVPLSLVAPFSTDTDADKAASARTLATVYRNQAPAAADRADVATIADLDKAVRDASIAAIGALTLPNTRSAIGAYLRSRITAQRDTPLTPALRSQIKGEFARIATALEALH